MSRTLVLLVAWGVSAGGAFFYGAGVGKDRAVAGQAKIDKAVEDTRAAALQGAAEAIAAMKPLNTTIYQKATHEIRTNTVYADCRHSGGMFNRVNSAITGQPEPLGDGSVSESQPAR